MSDNIQTNTTERLTPCLQKKIGKTAYLVEVHFSATSTQSVEDKLKRVILHDLAQCEQVHMENRRITEMKKITIKEIARIGIMAAAVYVASAFLQIPVPTAIDNTRLHMGNVLCLLAGMLLGPYGTGETKICFRRHSRRFCLCAPLSVQKLSGTPLCIGPADGSGYADNHAKGCCVGRKCHGCLSGGCASRTGSAPCDGKDFRR